MEKRDVILSIIIPIYNEEQILPELHDRLTKAAREVTEDYELIFVNDGSRDASLLGLMQIAEKDAKSFYIHFSRNFGHQIAVTAGIDYCSGDAVVIIDGDLQDPPELIPELYKKHKEGFEVVYARRESREGETFFKKFSAKMFYRTLRRLTSVDIPLDTGDFRLIDHKIVECLRQMPEQNKFLRGQIAWMGFNQTAVYFKRDKRKHGKSGYPLSKMLKFAMDGVTAFSDKPLGFVTRAGFIISGLSFLLILYAIFAHFALNQTITGWTSLIVSSMFIGGVQLISIGIIGEYIGRINKNVLDRPLYIIQDTNLKKEA
ncbi:MAG: glycosyltransferase family 2 protein [Weeksellaceae bacterium]